MIDVGNGDTGDWSNGMIGVSKTFGGSSILSSPVLKKLLRSFIYADLESFFVVLKILFNIDINYRNGDILQSVSSDINQFVFLKSISEIHF